MDVESSERIDPNKVKIIENYGINASRRRK